MVERGWWREDSRERTVERTVERGQWREDGGERAM